MQFRLLICLVATISVCAHAEESGAQTESKADAERESVSDVEANPQGDPKPEVEVDKDRQRLLNRLHLRLLKHPEDKTDDWKLHDKTLLGSNFTYGGSASVDMDFKSESSVSRKKHTFENGLDFYSYYYQTKDVPFQRFKGKFDASLKYLYEIVPRWSPFVAIKYENIYERKNDEGHTTENQGYDAGVRYEYSVKPVDFIAEVGHRVTFENSHDFYGFTQNLRVYASIDYHPEPFGFGLYAEAVAPYQNLNDYIIDFGPEVSYTFTGSKFFVGLSGDARWQGQADYPGAPLFNIWSGILYTGVKF